MTNADVLAIGIGLLVALLVGALLEMRREGNSSLSNIVNGEHSEAEWIVIVISGFVAWAIAYSTIMYLSS